MFMKLIFTNFVFLQHWLHDHLVKTMLMAYYIVLKRLVKDLLCLHEENSFQPIFLIVIERLKPRAAIPGPAGIDKPLLIFNRNSFNFFFIMRLYKFGNFDSHINRFDGFFYSTGTVKFSGSHSSEKF